MCNKICWLVLIPHLVGEHEIIMTLSPRTKSLNTRFYLSGKEVVEHHWLFWFFIWQVWNSRHLAAEVCWKNRLTCIWQFGPLKYWFELCSNHTNKSAIKLVNKRKFQKDVNVLAMYVCRDIVKLMFANSDTSENVNGCQHSIFV